MLLPLLGRMGADARLAVRRRGYYPRGGGEVEVAVLPAKDLRPLDTGTAGALERIAGVAHVGNLPEHIATRMRSSALERLGAPVRARAEIAARALGPDEATGQGGAIVAWASTEHTIVGAGRVAERGVRAETLGAAVGDELAADLGAARRWTSTLPTSCSSIWRSRAAAPSRRAACRAMRRLRSG